MKLLLFAKHVVFTYMIYSIMHYGCYSSLYLGLCCRMVSGTRSTIRGCGRGRGRGRDISVHESVHGGPIQGEHASVHQEENRDVHVSEQQEEDHNEHHADSEEVDLRQMMRTIMDHLPLLHDQNRGRRAEHVHRPRSRTPSRDHHRSIVSS